MNHIGISLQKNQENIYDIHLDSLGNLAFVHNSEAVGQHATQRLNTFEGEWFLDTAAGVPWLSEILGKKYDPELAESVVKSSLLLTDGIEEITAFSVRFNRALRNLENYSISVRTVYDEEINL
jgi:hypothetical protein